jgi:hypothetical protein
MNLDAQQALQLLEKIHAYYPIGLPHMRDDYLGFQKLLEIQKAKIKEVKELGPKNWNLLVDELNEEWGHNNTMNLAGTPFPCYQTKIFFDAETHLGLKKTTGIIMCVSLLVEHYALFVVDEYDFVSYSNETPIISQKIISSGEDHPLIGKRNLERLKQQIEKYFPKHQFVNHRVLFNYRILGAFGMAGWFDNLDQNVIYDYLFGGDMIGIKYSVTL